MLLRMVEPVLGVTIPVDADVSFMSAFKDPIIDEFSILMNYFVMLAT